MSAVMPPEIPSQSRIRKKLSQKSTSTRKKNPEMKSESPEIKKGLPSPINTKRKYAQIEEEGKDEDTEIISSISSDSDLDADNVADDPISSIDITRAFNKRQMQLQIPNIRADFSKDLININRRNKQEKLTNYIESKAIFNVAARNNNLFKLLILTHGATDLDYLILNKSELVVSSITAAKRGCSEISSPETKNMYALSLLSLLKRKKSMFRLKDSEQVKKIMEESEITVNPKDAKKFYNYRRGISADVRLPLSRYSTIGQEHRLWSVSLNIKDSPYFDKNFSVNNDRKNRGILFSDRYISERIESLIPLFNKIGSEELFQIDISNINNYEYTHDKGNKLQIVNHTDNTEKYDVINSDELYNHYSFLSKKPLYFIITADRRCIVLSEFIFEMSQSTPKSQKLSSQPIQPIKRSTTTLVQNYDSDKFILKTFKEIIGEKKQPNNRDLYLKISRNTRDKARNIKTSYRLCYYFLMNLSVCPLLQLYISRRSPIDSRTNRPIPIDKIEQNSMSKYLLSQKYSVTFSNNKENMIAYIYKSTIMEWSKYCKNKGLLIIDLSCSNINSNRSPREDDFDAISFHSKNPRGHSTKIKRKSIVGGKKTKKYNYK
jgi:hypothetical protein